jgi:hypothetical protein
MTYGLGETQGNGSSIPLAQKVQFEDPPMLSLPQSSPPVIGLLLEDVNMPFNDGEQGVHGQGNEEQRCCHRPNSAVLLHASVTESPPP